MLVGCYRFVIWEISGRYSGESSGRCVAPLRTNSRGIPHRCVYEMYVVDC